MPLPKYLQTKKSSQLREKIKKAYKILESCVFCERRCKINRLKDERGFCGVGKDSYYTSEFLHMGEEEELVPSHTIFFSGCSFRCCYCQNWTISQFPQAGEKVEPKKLAEIIKEREKEEAKNVNFVGGNPDQHVPVILETISYLDVKIPLIWNSNSYASTETMDLLDGVIDLYLSDFRYGNNNCAMKLSKVPKVWEIITRNLLLAKKQADLLIRHLVLPGHLDCCSEPIIKWVSKNMPDVRFNLMFQYHPEYKAIEYPGLDRTLNLSEIEKAKELVKKYGLFNLVEKERFLV